MEIHEQTLPQMLSINRLYFDRGDYKIDETVLFESAAHSVAKKKKKNEEKLKNKLFQNYRC